MANGAVRPDVTLATAGPRTMRLAPSDQTTVWQNHISRQDFAYFDPYGTAIDTPNAGEIMVGDNHIYDPGTDPFPCWTDAVGRMAAFPDSYHGFVVSGANESLDKDNLACLSRYTDFALTLTYALPKA